MGASIARKLTRSLGASSLTSPASASPRFVLPYDLFFMRRDSLSILKACSYIFYLICASGSHVTWNSAVPDPNVWCCTVILQIFGVVLFSVFSVVNGFTELKRHLNAKNTLSDHDSIHGHRNLNETERWVIARYRNFNAPNICKITVLLFLCTLARVHKNKSMQRLISSPWGPGTAKFQVTWLLRIVQKGVSMWQCCAVDCWLMSAAYRCTT